MPLHPKRDPTESCPRKTDDNKGETGEMLRAREHWLPLQRPWMLWFTHLWDPKPSSLPSQTPTLTHAHNFKNEMGSRMSLTSA